jgi:hypothetical protein
MPGRSPKFCAGIWQAGEGFGNVVTHYVPIGDFDGPHPFFDSKGDLL